jgi:two-component system, OmpR family, heavy metal sensor histidine kinase CusS
MSWKSASALSLKVRMALICMAGSLAILLVAVGFMEFRFRHEIRTRNMQLLVGKLQDIATVLARHPDDPAALEEEALGDAPLNRNAPIFIRVSKNGRLILESPGIPAGLLQGKPLVGALDRDFLVAERTDGAYLTQGAMDITGESHLARSLRKQMLNTLLLMGFGLTLLGAWATHQALKPLRAIAESTGGITALRLKHRLDPGDVPRELRDLVLALNGMLNRLDQAFERLSRFSVDLAHELRTPINNLMGEGGVILARDRSAGEYREVLESSMEEYRRLSALISRMLFLGRVEDPTAMIRALPIEAGPLVDGVLAYYEPMAEEDGVRLLGAASGSVLGDAEMLRQALGNLVANALDATPRGGEIQVQMRVHSGQAVIEVKDTGRGIPPEDLPFLFDRFYRVSGAIARKSSGTGLGLAIVQSIARMHGGDVEISSEPGAGTTVRLHFPT